MGGLFLWGNMMKKVTDREVYPAMWITALAALGLYLLWRYVLGAPTVSRCWIWSHWHIYCLGCGGTRALIALLHGQLWHALCCHLAVPVAAVWWVVYMISQTVWRLRRRRGWALHYDNRWFGWMALLLVVNCAVHNVLLLAGYPMP